MKTKSKSKAEYKAKLKEIKEKLNTINNSITSLSDTHINCLDKQDPAALELSAKLILMSAQTIKSIADDIEVSGENPTDHLTFS